MIKVRENKDRAIGARIEASLEEDMIKHLNRTGLSIGELVRRAIQEYLWSHPLE